MAGASKIESPRRAVELAREVLKSARGVHVSISTILLRDLIDLAAAWTYTRSDGEAQNLPKSEPK